MLKPSVRGRQDFAAAEHYGCGMRFVVCGEALIDMIQQGAVSPQASTWAALSGGSPLNTAVALGRLAEPVQFLGRLGGDAFGAQNEGHLAANGVGLDLAVRAPEPTSLAIVSLDDEGKANYTFHFSGTSNYCWQAAEFPELVDTDWLHFASIGVILGESAELIRDFVASSPARVSYDINVRPTVLPDMAAYRDVVSRHLRVVGQKGGILKASDEDLELLTEGGDPIEVAKRWLTEFGLSLAVLTLGPDGAVAIRPDGSQVRVGGHQIELVDTVGAGDTFMAGFLAKYANDESDIEAALKHGMGAAALVCTKQGANPPTAHELAAFLQAH